MKTTIPIKVAVFLIALQCIFLVGSANAEIVGITGPTFDLVAQDTYISTPDGYSVYTWGYGDANGSIGTQYPGPTLLVNEGDTVTVNLTNNLSQPVSIVFPGQEGVSATGGSPGLLAAEADAGGGSVSYSFVASQPGTYTYYSGSNIQLQIEMGLFGALIVRPATEGQAYDHPDTAFDEEFLFVLSEIDPVIHELVEWGHEMEADFVEPFPVMWFINGRGAPDTMLKNHVPWLPSQPYGAMVKMSPGDELLFRFVGAGRDLHPFHHHGNNSTVIAKDARLLESSPGVGPDIGVSDFTHTIVPGQTLDSIFTWTGHGLGWDIYGHDPRDPMEPGEDIADHGKPIPLIEPEAQDLEPGNFYSGSPFLGMQGHLPPGTAINRIQGGYFFMMHSHNEKEMVNFDVFPGGMMTMLVIFPPAPAP